jgi:hypothetical protein
MRVEQYITFRGISEIETANMSWATVTLWYSAVEVDFFSKIIFDSYVQLHGESEYLVLDLNRNKVLAKKLKK